MEMIYLHLLAANYDCAAYGAGDYSNNVCNTSNSGDTTQGTTGTSTNSNPGSVADELANTGYDILLPAALALAIIIASAIFLIKKVIKN